MNHQYTTPETFKPGERWLVELSKLGSTLLEVRVLEWSESRLYVKLKNPESRLAYWEDSADINPIERLPDESNDDKTAKPAGTVEGDSGQFNYCIKCGKPLKASAITFACSICEQEIKEFIAYEAAQKAEATQAESAAQSEHNGSD